MGIHSNVINFIDHVQHVHLGYSLVEPSLGHITGGYSLEQFTVLAVLSSLVEIWSLMTCPL